MNEQTTNGKIDSKAASWAFWVTIAVLACMVGAIKLGVFERPTREISTPVLEEIFTEAAQIAHSEATSRVDGYVDELYGSVYEAIPTYADFHYSFVGQYVELSAALFEQNMSKELESRLFGNFNAGLDEVGTRLDNLFLVSYRNALDSETRDILGNGFVRLGPITEFALENAVNRAKTTMPVTAVASATAGGVALRTTAKAMAQKLFAKLAIKAATKAGAAIAGGTAGTLACAWTGFIAMACGVTVAAVTWVATDAAFIYVDEGRNRDEFEADLRKMIDQDKKEKKQLFRDALTAKANKVEKFTLSELNRTSPINIAN